LDNLKWWAELHTDFLHSAEVGGLPVMTSPLFWQDGHSKPAPLGPKKIARQLVYVHQSFDVIMPQDGLGWGTMQLGKNVEYWKALRDELTRVGSKAELWQNSDLFDFSANGPAGPGDIQKRMLSTRM